jgi:hypothetical protein
MTSPYAHAAPRLIDCGYSAIPILPGSKRPGTFTLGSWRGTSDWTRFCQRLPTPLEVECWSRWPDAGLCVAIDHQLKIIDIDTDDHALMSAVLSAIPFSDLIKRGAKGFSAFYCGSASIVSQSFSVGKARVVDLLCYGRQTVLPPTIHPNTGLPYTNRPFAGTARRRCAATALRNLDRWVPALGLPGTRRSGRGFRAVAAWRRVENANLSFHVEGIRDWGADEAHTPLNVVMLTFGVDLRTATEWLAQQVRFEPSLPEPDGFDVARFAGQHHFDSIRPTTP